MQRKLVFAFFVLGFFSVVSQITLLREFTSTIFSGNELFFGIILFNWMLTVGLGSYFTTWYLKKFKAKITLYVLLQIFSCLIFLLQICIIRNLRNILGISILEAYGTIPLFFYSFLIIFPLCFILGAKFVLGVKIYSQYKYTKKEIGEVYLYETIGMTLGGVIYSYIFANFIHSFWIFYILAILNLLSSFLLLNLSKKFLIIYFLILLSFKYINPLEYSTAKSLFIGYNLKEYKNSIYGNIAVTEKGNQYNFYSSGTLIFSYPNPDYIRLEEIIHFPLFAAKEKENILLISGGVGGALKEILKHNPQKITYVELDPLLIKISLKYTKEFNKKVKIVYTDGRFFLKRSKEKFDIVIMNLPPPKTLQLNRFYTKEFFREVKKNLKKDGVFSFSLPSSETFQNEELIRENLSIFNTLKEVFPYSILIPGDSLIFISSSSFLSKDRLIKNIEDKKIKTRVVNSYYARYKLRKDKINFLIENFRKLKKVEINYDFKPVAVFYTLILDNILFYPEYKNFFNYFLRINLPVIFILIIFFYILLFIYSRKYQFVKILFPLFIISFSGIVQEMILIFSYQTIYGYIYSKIGILICTFMIGMSLGVYLMNQKLKNDISILKKLILLFVFYNFAIMFCFRIIEEFPPFIITFIILILTLFSGLFVGISFPLVSKVFFDNYSSISKTAGIVYSIDLFGSSLGVLLSSSLFMPLLGIYSTLIILSLLLFLAYIIF